MELLSLETEEEEKNLANFLKSQKFRKSFYFRHQMNETVMTLDCL